MKSTIDESGRLLIPEEIRDAAGLKPGMTVEVRCQDGHVEIEPEYLSVHLERRGRLTVAVADSPVEPLTSEMVEAVREAILQERVDLAIGCCAYGDG